MGVGQQIRAARKNAGMTQAELAQKLGIPFQSISQWERETRRPKLDTLERIANALNIHVLDLLGISKELENYDVEWEITPVEPITPEKIKEVEELKKLVACGPKAIYDSFSDAQKAELLESIMQPLHAQLNEAFDNLNEQGQQIAVQRIQELGRIPEYRRQDTQKE